jgi:TPP-dependent 2-oxoacid decarboxylase
MRQLRVLTSKSTSDGGRIGVTDAIESKVTGGDAVITAVVRSGVDTVFALHGAHIEALFRASADRSVRLVDVRHESSAGFAAEAYARVRRGLGVAFVTAGPGFTNVMTSIANAFEDKTPVLYVAGSAHLREAESNALQAGIDQVAVARPVTKWAHRVMLAEQIPRMVSQAIRIATSPPCGPVLLDIPIDVLQAAMPPGTSNFPLAVEIPQFPDPQAFDAAVALMASAVRPVLMLGQGAAQAGAEYDSDGAGRARIAQFRLSMDAAPAGRFGRKVRPHPGGGSRHAQNHLDRASAGASKQRGFGYRRRRGICRRPRSLVQRLR